MPRVTITSYREKYGLSTVTQEEAKTLGLNHFFVGETCVNGHTDVRRFNNKPSGECMECSRLRGVRSRANNPWESYSEERKQRVLAQGRKDSKTESYRKRKKAYNRIWAKRNSGKLNAWTTARKKHIKRATPKGLTDFNKKQIQLIYVVRDLLTKRTGVEYHVDHVVPLRGDTVCGLHTPNNLRIITAEENMKKRNHFNGYFEYSPNIQVNTLKQEN